MRKILILVLISISFSFAADWPQFRGPDRNGVTGERDWHPEALTPKNIRWTVNIGHGFGPPIVVGDRIFIIGEVKEEQDRIQCLDARTGREIWHYTYDCPSPNGCFKSYRGPRTSPVWNDGKLYTLSHQGHLICLNAADGALLWKKHLVEDFDAERPKYGFTGSPVIQGKRLIFHARKSGLALDKSSGEKIWTSPPGRASYSTPVLFDWHGRDSVLFFAHQMLVCRDLTSGDELWRHPWSYVNNDGASSASPVVVRESFFVSSGYRKGAAVIDFKNGKPKQRWFEQEIRNEFGSSIFVDGCLYAPHGDTRRTTAYLKCVDYNTGNILWTWDTGHCSLIRVDDKFIILNQWGKVYIAHADRNGYRIIAQSEIMDTTREKRCWTAPVMANGNLYIRRNDGRLACIKLKNNNK